MALLCCPVCKEPLGACESGLEDTELALRCATCAVDYAIRAGVPDLVPPAAQNDADWDVWRKHLVAFQKRRDNRQSDPGKYVSQMSRSGGPQQAAFANFTGITDGVVLDIGCGPGKFRFRLPGAAEYIGMDPVPLVEATGFAFVRGIAENIPLPDASVRHITVLSALDHFKDCEAFLRESVRILEPDGRLHMIQQIHEHGPSIRGLAHWLKDALEDRATKHDDTVPHHMTEFDREDLNQLFERYFVHVAEQLYSMSFYTPRRVFITLAPKS